MTEETLQTITDPHNIPARPLISVLIEETDEWGEVTEQNFGLVLSKLAGQLEAYENLDEPTPTELDQYEALKARIAEVVTQAPKVTHEDPVDEEE